VVGVPDPRWGEVPLAFVTRRTGATVTEAELTAHLRERLAGFKVPRVIRFATLPKTSTGKIQKNVLRSEVRRGETAPEADGCPLTGSHRSQGSEGSRP
jgi:fatty-acyl-CoA synthase